VITFVEGLQPTHLSLLNRLRRRVQQLQREACLLAQIGGTPLIELPAVEGVRLFAKLEGRNPSGSLKDRIVLYLIADGMERGRIAEPTTLVEGTSGNTGIALAMIGAALGHPVLIFMPEDVSEERRRLMEAFGAEVCLTPGELGTDGAIEAARKLHDPPRYCWLAQHENPANIWAHYDTTGAEILEQCPDVAAFVAPTGTTGTLMGVSMRLKRHNSGVEIVAVWPEDWIMGLRRPVGEKKPEIYDERWVNRVIEISDPDAKAATRELARRFGLLVGPSSGAAWLAAQQLAEEYAAQGRRGAKIVVCFPDEGSRYLSTDTFF
jgi:cysteine synthase B